MNQPSAWSKTRTNRMIECEIAFCKEYSYFQKPTKQKIRTPWEIMLYCSRVSITNYLKNLNAKRNKYVYSSIYENLERMIRKQSEQNNILLKTREIKLQKPSRNIPFIDEKMVLKLTNYSKKRVSSFLQIPLIEELTREHTSWHLLDNLSLSYHEGAQIYSAPNLIIESKNKIRLITFQIQGSLSLSNAYGVTHGNLIWAIENEFLPDESETYSSEIYSWSGSGWDIINEQLDETAIKSFKSVILKDIENMDYLLAEYKQNRISNLKVPESKLICKRCRYLDFCSYSILD